MIFLIDIENELKIAQIEYIKKQLNILYTMYYNERVDYEYDKICAAYDEMLERTEMVDELYILYKQYYQSALNYLFRDEAYEETTVYMNCDTEIENELTDENLPFD